MSTTEAWEPFEAQDASFEGFHAYMTRLDADPGWVEIVLRECRAIFSQDGITGLQIRSADRTVLAHYFAGFLDPAFSQTVMKTRELWIKAQAFREIQAGRPVVLPSPERDLNRFAEAARQGLHLHLFGFDWVGGFERDVTFRLRAALANDIVERFVGAPIRQVTVEATGNYVRESEQAGFRVLRDYEGETAKLMIADADSLNVVKSPVHMALFKRTPPRLKLSPVYRRVLYFYARGFTDDEIAEAVSLSKKSMKTYWDRIFTAFEEVVDFGASPSKRRAVGAYLRLHPEEMWPV